MSVVIRILFINLYSEYTRSINYYPLGTDIQMRRAKYTGEDFKGAICKNSSSAYTVSQNLFTVYLGKETRNA